MSYVIPGGLTTFTTTGVYDTNTTPKNGDMPDVPNRPSKDINVNMITIILSALIFVAILSWIDVVRLWYENTYPYNRQRDFGIMYHQMGYALFITLLVLVLVYVIYKIDEMIDF